MRSATKSLLRRDAVRLDKLHNNVVVLDGGVLIGLALAEEHFEPIKQAIVGGKIAPITHELAVIELLYIICRKASMIIAKRKLDLLRASGFVDLIPANELVDDVALIKCERKIALADCFTIALATKMSAIAIFAKLEKELGEELAQKPLPCDTYFVLDDILLRKGETIEENTG